MKIVRITGKEIFDSRGLPTVSCEIELEDGHCVEASVPTGTSCSAYEMTNVYDGGNRLFGLGVQKAVHNIDTIIAPELVGSEPNVVQMDIFMLDLDNTEDKSNLGANTMLAVSMALCRAQALLEGFELYELIAYLCDFETISLPCPMFNMINGGAHSFNKNLHIQEFMLMPVGMSSFRASLELGIILFQTLKAELIAQEYLVGIGLEGGLAVNFKNEREVLDFLLPIIKDVENACEGSIMIVLDIAASQFYNAQKQKYSWNNSIVSSSVLVEWYQDLLNNYPIYAIEDPLGDNDWDGWAALSAALSNRVHIFGDDIFATNPQRIWRGIEENIAQGIVIKPNQIGTITEALQAVKLCKENDRSIIASHRSGETNDTFIADLAVGISASHIKAGGCSRGERIAKYNRLINIEDDLVLAF